jgi:hypothetical protein
MKGIICMRLMLILPTLSLTARPALLPTNPQSLIRECNLHRPDALLCLRGGLDTHKTGKFVVEHRPSKVDLGALGAHNATILRKSSLLPAATLSDLYELQENLGEFANRKVSKLMCQNDNQGYGWIHP